MHKTERQEVILNLISARSVGSQQELARILRTNGFSTTQASISRDLDELGVIKVDGSYKRPEKRAENVLFGIQGLETAGDSMVVVKCLSGMASAAAVRIDAARIVEIVGTIAGDDTIFVAVKDQRSQRNVMRKIWEVFEGKALGQVA
ncbi:MAG: arginine repressor [Pyrinomonadaceae bacterium]